MKRQRESESTPKKAINLQGDWFDLKNANMKNNIKGGKREEGKF